MGKKINSRDKGKRGELELSHFLQDHGIEARRGGQQGAGGSVDAPDVIHSIPNIHIECKRTERLQLDKAYEQAVQDANDLIPTVWHRRNRQPWMVTLSAEDFLKIFGCLMEDRAQPVLQDNG